MLYLGPTRPLSALPLRTMSDGHDDEEPRGDADDAEVGAQHSTMGCALLHWRGGLNLCRAYSDQVGRQRGGAVQYERNEADALNCLGWWS